MIYIFLADGFEEVEALTPVDYSRRCELEVCCVGVGGKKIIGGHNIKIEADVEIENCNFNLKSNDMVVLPGGINGTNNLKNNLKVLNVVKAANNFCGLAAICAAPIILGELQLLIGKKACCYPGLEKFLKGAEIVNQPVVVSDKIITSKGAGTAQQFSFEIVKFLKGEFANLKLKHEVQWLI